MYYFSVANFRQQWSTSCPEGYTLQAGNDLDDSVSHIAQNTPTLVAMRQRLFPSLNQKLKYHVCFSLTSGSKTPINSCYWHLCQSLLGDVADVRHVCYSNHAQYVKLIFSVLQVKGQLPAISLYADNSHHKNKKS